MKKRSTLLLFFLSFNLVAQPLEDCSEEVSDSETVYYQPIHEVISTRDSMGKIRLKIYKDMIERRLFIAPEANRLELLHAEFKMEKSTYLNGLINFTQSNNEENTFTKEVINVDEYDDTEKVNELLGILEKATSHSSDEYNQVVYLEHDDGKKFMIDFRLPIMMNPAQTYESLPEEGHYKRRITYAQDRSELAEILHNQFFENATSSQTYQYVKGCDKNVVIGTRTRKNLLGLPVSVFQPSSSSSSAR